SWVMQAGFAPPTVTVAVRQGRFIGDWIASGEPFVINVLGESQSHLLKHFARGFEPEQPAFEGVVLQPCARGVPILTEALGHLECEPTSHLDSGDHRVFLARVVRGALNPEDRPMIHVRKTGANY
ncbi:MAG: flavin reductase family protein, partial [Planctomycetota bacterium]